MTRSLTISAAVLALVLLAASALAQQSGAPFTLHAESDVVLVNVTVRNKNGQFVRDLKQEDFSIAEDNRGQKIVSFDVENTDVVPAATQLPANLLTLTKPGTAPSPEQTVQPADLKDRRLVILFFDRTSMQPEEVERAVKAASNYVDKQMLPADLVGVASLQSSLRIDQDFTSDHALLKAAIASFGAGGGQGFEAGSTGTTDSTPDTAQPFTPDDTEYNIFNTDKRLEALRSLAASVAQIDQKKSLIYFSSGMDRTGIENESELRAAVNAAVRANLAIYTMDIRGLQALVPGGEAQSASVRGVSAYSGRSTLNQYDANFSTQETLVTLAGDTGGRAFLDSNDFGKVFTQVQQDTATYYILGYHSSNAAKDGRFRRITVRLNRSGTELAYRKGYYAPADFQHSTHENREYQLEQELASDLPDTDLPVYLSAGYLRSSGGKFFVPVSVVVPASEIPFTEAGDRSKATLDVLGMISDEAKRPVGRIRDTVKVAVDRSAAVRSKNVQYDGSFLLAPGRYHLKFVLRENQTGRMGSFETDFSIPDFKSTPLKVSSVILSSQLQPATRKSDNPLVNNGSEVIPSVTHVFAENQHLYLYYEVYDPGRETAQMPSSANKPGIRLLTNVSFFRGETKAYETELVEARELNRPARHAQTFQLDVPLSSLKPGFYTCQVNVIDDAAGYFLFPRLPLLMRAK